jgi:hypothetical protein
MKDKDFKELLCGFLNDPRETRFEAKEKERLQFIEGCKEVEEYIDCLVTSTLREWVKADPDE